MTTASPSSATALRRCPRASTRGASATAWTQTGTRECAYFRGGVSGRTFSYVRPMRGGGSSAGCAADKADRRCLRRRYLPSWWPTDIETVLFNPGSARIEYYRYRGAKIATPSAWGRFQHDPAPD